MKLYLNIEKRTHVKEVTAGDTEDLHISVVRRLECIEVWVLRGEPSVGGHIDQQHHLAAVLRQGDVPGAVQQSHLVVVEAALALPAGRHHQPQQGGG